MSEAPEIPEAEDPFAKRIAITIAILAVAISLIGNLGDNAKTESIIKTTAAANQWGYFQAKSIKEHGYVLDKDLLSALTPAAVDPARRDELLKGFDRKIAKYETEKKQIGFGETDAQGTFQEIKDDQGKVIISAKQYEEEAAHGIRINDRCDQSSLLLQIAVILCSVAILVRMHSFWFIGMGIGAIGTVVGATAFLM
jgi:hypothetical protein